MIINTLLVLVPNQKIGKLVEFFIEVNKEIPVTLIKTNETESDMHIDQLSKVFILDKQVGGSLDLFMMWRELNKGQPTIIIDQDKQDWRKFEIDPAIFKGSLELCIQEISGIINRFPKEELKIELEEFTEYVVISLDTLTLFKALPFDVYVSLKSGRKVKVFSKGMTVGEADCEPYRAKGVYKLSVNRNELFETNLILEKSLGIIRLSDQELLDLNKYRQILEKQNIQLSAYQGKAPKILCEKFIEQPISFKAPLFLEDKEKMALDRACLNIIEKNLSFPPLLDHMTLLTKNKLALELVKKRVGLMGNILFSLSRELEWESDQTTEILLYACFLHDMPLYGNYELLKLSLGQEKELKADLKKNYINHSNLAVELMNKDKKHPPKADVILVQHHERPDGSGFPLGINKHVIQPYSGAFILALSLAEYIMSSEKWDKNEYIAASDIEYKTGTFVKPLKALQELLKNNEKRMKKGR